MYMKSNDEELRNRPLLGLVFNGFYSWQKSLWRI